MWCDFTWDKCTEVCRKTFNAAEKVKHEAETKRQSHDIL